ncbi:MAG: hypothetical protein ACOZQL_39255 [Myxococcota bacterium]
MSQEYWLADSEARVLGPISLDVITALHARGKLNDVRAVSRDGRKFVPLREMPELVAVLSAPVTADDSSRAQSEATRQIRDWLARIAQRPSHEVFKLPANSSREAFRAAFFALVHRYVPSRLPPDTTPELRLACEDAFLALAERMVEVERQLRGPSMPTPPPLPAPAPAPEPTASPARITHRSGGLQVQLALKRGDARPFTFDREHNWQTDCLFIGTAERATPGTPVELVVSFEGHVTQLNATARVQAARVGGFTVKLLNLGEAERSLIRTWVARAG